MQLHLSYDQYLLQEHAYASLYLIIAVSLAIWVWVHTPLHRLLSTFIYRHFMMWRECRARRLAQEKQAGAQPHEKH